MKPDDATAYLSRGVARGELGRHNEAIADFNEAIRLKPDDAMAYRSRGTAKAELGQEEEAQEDFAQAKMRTST